MASKRLLSCCCWRSCWHTQKGQASNWLASLARILPPIPLNIIKSDYIQLLPSTGKFPWKVKKKKWLLTVSRDFSFLCGPYVENMIRGATLIQNICPPTPPRSKVFDFLPKKLSSRLTQMNESKNRIVFPYFRAPCSFSVIFTILGL